jgi:DnaJ-class molecular chaperone
VNKQVKKLVEWTADILNGPLPCADNKKCPYYQSITEKGCDQCEARQILSHSNLAYKVKCDYCLGKGTKDCVNCPRCKGAGFVYISLADALKETL